MWSRQLTSNMGINQEEFVKAFILALSNEQVIQKLEQSICGQLVREVNELRKVVDDRDKKINNLEKELTNLKVVVDEQEQYSRRNNLRISGVPESDHEDTAKVTLDIINTRVCPDRHVALDDIDRVHRVGQRRVNGAPRAIIVRFATYRTRQRIYKNRRNLDTKRKHRAADDPWGTNKATNPDVSSETTEIGQPTKDDNGENGTNVSGTAEGGASGGGTHPCGAGAGESQPGGASGGGPQPDGIVLPTIFINEDLTKLKDFLLWQARTAKKNNLLNDCWTVDGNVNGKGQNQQGKIHKKYK